MNLGIKLYLALVAIGGLLSSYLLQGSLIPLFLFVCAAVAAITYGIVVKYLAKNSRFFRWFGLFNLFSVSFYLVYFWYALLTIFYPDLIVVWRYPDTANSVLGLALSGYALFFLGYLCILKNQAGDYAKQKVPVFKQEVHSVVLNVLFIATILAFILFMATVGRSYLSGVYDGSRNFDSGATYFQVLFNVLLSVTISVDIHRLRMSHRSMSFLDFTFSLNKPLLVFSVFYVLFMLYVGDRGYAIFTTALYLASYGFYFNKVTFRSFIVLLVSGAFLMSMVRLIRSKEENYSFKDRLQDGLFEAKHEQMWFSYASDLSGSVATFQGAYDYVERSGPAYGSFSIVSLSAMVPYGSSTVLGMPMVNKYGRNSSNFLSDYILGEQRVWGTGTSVLADLYLDFSVPGVLIGMFLLGFIFCYIERRVYFSYSVYINYIYTILLSYAVYWPRSAYFESVRTLAWGLLALYVFYSLYGARYKLVNSDVALQSRRKKA